MNRPYDKPTYIYVLKLKNDKWYVGYSKGFNRRMRSHFMGKGATAIKEIPPVSIHEVFVMNDFQIRSRVARYFVEVLTANRYAEHYGYNNVRGGKHGKGWCDRANHYCFRDVRYYKRYINTPAGKETMESLVLVDPTTLLSDSVLKIVLDAAAKKKRLITAHVLIKWGFKSL